MAYNPADLHLPNWLLNLLNALVRIRLPLWKHWAVNVTRPGAMMFSSLAGVWAAALYSANNLLYLCGCMLLLIALGAMIQGIRLLKQTPELSAAFPSFLEAGSPTVLRQTTPSHGEQSGIVDIHMNTASINNTDTVQLHWWCSTNETQLRGRLQISQRCYLQTTRLELSSSAPLGLWNIHYRKNENIQLAVVPKAVAWLDKHRSISNTQYSTSRQDGDEFNELREYVTGDNLARIHWRKAGIETSSWRVKQFNQSSSMQTAQHSLCVDLRLPAELDTPSFERLLGMCWWWFNSRVQQGLPIKHIILGQSLFLCQTEAERITFIRALASASVDTIPPQHSEEMLLSLTP